MRCTPGRLKAKPFCTWTEPKSPGGGIAGDASNWSGQCRLVLGNEVTGDRPWLGTLFLVAIYDRAIALDEVQRNFQAGPGAAKELVVALPAAADREIDFVKDVQPLLRERCFECHATGNEEGGLNLGLRSRVHEGGEHGRVLVPGQGAASRLVQYAAGVPSDKRMPPEGPPLTDQQVGVLRAWIDQGAPWPPDADVADPRIEKGREHWAFQPLGQGLSSFAEANAVEKNLNSIDAFVQARLEQVGLEPAERAEPRVLLRRLWMDMLGLPPSPRQLRQFEDASRHDPFQAWRDAVEQALASPHYGERWGRHWLDVARYADSDGQEADRDRPLAYEYRDYVIQALNEDMPYDQFLQWQIAGDEMQPDNPQAVAATGFLVAGPHTVLADTFLEEERLRNRYNELDDMTTTIGVGMLGLTVGCARCHDHKYDAISAREYYRLLAAVHNGDRQEVKVKTDEREVQLLAFHDAGPTPTTTWLFRRGDFYDRNLQVRLGFPAVLMRDATVDDYVARAKELCRRPDSSGQRTALALWLTDVEHGAGPLAARVIVNRLWQHHFGRALVETPNDLGVRGAEPTHPRLLEWLAVQLVEGGWRLKSMHRRILLSRTYQQGLAGDVRAAEADPEDRFLSRRRPRRLEAEVLRDAMLAVAGTLNDEAFGPAFKPPIAPEAQAARNLKSSYPADAKDEPATRRRSVYMFQKRVVPYPLLQVFDRPDALQSCGRRDQTTVAPQALAVLNDGFVRLRAREFADRLAQTGADDADRVDLAFRLALAHSPSEAEAEACQQFLVAQPERRGQREKAASTNAARLDALADFCHSLFGLNEFLYID